MRDFVRRSSKSTAMVGKDSKVFPAVCRINVTATDPCRRGACPGDARRTRMAVRHREGFLAW